MEEPVYKTKYCSCPLPADWMESWEAPETKTELSLPAPNPYIATEFDLIQSVRPLSMGATYVHAAQN